MDIIIDQSILQKHPEYIFVFGDNLIHQGYGGAAQLRDEPNSYGFITKKYPGVRAEDYYTPEEYAPVYCEECAKLITHIIDNPNRLYLISKLGAGLANQFGIFEQIIQPTIRTLLAPYPNVFFLWD